MKQIKLISFTSLQNCK